MDTKDIVDEEENNNVDVATSSADQPDVNNNSTSNTSSTGLQQIDDDTDGLPLPMGAAEVISNRAEPPKQTRKVEQLDDNNLGPEPPAAMLEASFNAADPDVVNKSISNNISSINDNEISPPVPFNSAEFDQEEYEIAKIKRKVKDEMNQTPAVNTNTNTNTNDEDEEEVFPSSGRDSVYEPPTEVIEGGEEILQTPIDRWDDIGRGRNNDNNARDIESQTRTNAEGGSINNDTAMVDAEANVVPESNQEGLPEIEAYLVEEEYDDDGEVYIATPTLPWWKQRRTKILLGVVLVIVSTLAIVLGIELSKDDQVTLVNNVTNVIVNVTDSPSISLAPSLSSAPSSSPTECVNKIISNKQEIDLMKDLQVNDPRDSKVAVDGRNMVVVALDGKYYTKNVFGNDFDGPVFVSFYVLDNEDEDEWQRIQTPIRIDYVSDSDGSVKYSVSLSGSTAFVGFPNANDGAVLVYELNQFDEWEKVDDPFVQASNTTHKGFGLTLDIDGDLACVIHDDGANLYYQDKDNKWVQFDTIKDMTGCSISGDTISVMRLGISTAIKLYKYNRDQNTVYLVQDPIPTKFVRSMDLSNDYLVYWQIGLNKEETSAFIYHRNEMKQTFTLHNQQLNITGRQFNSLALDNDILLVSVGNSTHIYSLIDDSWKESITIDNHLMILESLVGLF